MLEKILADITKFVTLTDKQIKMRNSWGGSDEAVSGNLSLISYIKLYNRIKLYHIYGLALGLYIDMVLVAPSMPPASLCEYDLV